MAEEFPVRYVPPADPNIGRRVDVYFVIRVLLGRGGMGAAYLAEHEALSTVRCVVKLVLAEFAQHPVALTRYRMETRAVALLKHENIVRLDNFGVLDDGQLYMRFEYIEGKSLFRHIADQGGRLSIREATNLIFQLCDALDYAHACGVIHRDLKPDNVMVEINPKGFHLPHRVKLLDFGIAKVTSETMEHTASGVTMGTPSYMAPEQVTNAAGATGKADVFSLGTIYYACLTAKLPWGSPQSDAAIYFKQRTEPPIVPPEELMPAEVRAVVFRALSLHPDDRPTPREFAVLLAAAIRPENCGVSGTEILREVKRDWATASPPHIPTLPRPVAGPEAPEMPDEPAPVAPERATATPRAKPSPDLTTTAKSRPRAIAAALGSADRAMSRARAAPEPMSPPASEPIAAPAPAAVPPVSPPPRSVTPQTPIAAGLPTGLLSQRFDAQEPPVESRERSLVVASELEMASGTPEPQPYAHADLPSVLVSNTQLTGAAPSPVVRPPEAPPFIVLPHPAQDARSVARARSRLVLLGACACVSAAFVVALLVTQLRSSRASSGTGALTANAGPPEATALVVADAGTPGTNAGSAVEATAMVPGPVADAAVSAPATDRAGPAMPSQPRLQTQPADSNATGRQERLARASAAGVEDTMRPRSPVVPGTHGGTLERSPSSPQTGMPADSARAADAADAKAHVAAAATDSAHPVPARDVSRPTQKPSEAPVAVVKKTGELAVLVKPWALLWINGRPMNQTPYRDTIPTGRYHLRLKNDDLGKDERIVVTVTPNHTTIIERKW